MKTLRKLWPVTTLLLAVMPGMARATTTNTDQRLKQRKPGVSLALLLMLSVLFALLVTTPGVLAANGDFTIDLAASAPQSYNHLNGGGAFDDRTIGVDKDVVESLEGGDFSCGDIVTYLAEVTVDDTTQADTDASQTIELNFSFLADTTGQSGVAIGDIVLVQVNYGTIEDLIAGENNVDDGIYDDGGSTATLIYEHLTGPLFQAGSELHGTVELDDLERNETVVVRIDVKLFCDPNMEKKPTGNLQGALTDARLTFINDTEPVDPPEAVPGGEQTIPFYQIGNLCFPELEIQKTVNTSDGTCPGVETLTIYAGETVKYCYVVTNPSSCAPLYNVEVVDDNGTPGNTGDDFTVTLSAGLTDVDGDGTADDLNASSTATGEALVTINRLGTIINIGTATGDDSVIEPTTLTANDTATVVAEGVPSIDIRKNDEGPDSQQVVTGGIATFEIVVTNTGDVLLTDVVVSDPVAPDCDRTFASLAVGASETYTCTVNVTGDMENIATVTGTPPVGGNVTDSDPSSVDAVNPSVSIEKSTNGEDADTAPGPFVLQGQLVTWQYVVENTGDVTLTNIEVTDDQGVTVTCLSGGNVILSLAPGTTETCTAIGTAMLDQYANIGTASTTFMGHTVEDTDPSHYFGADPAFTVTKLCDSLEPVPQLATGADFEVEFENTGNVELDITADDGIGTFTLAVEETKYFTVTIDGPFSGQPTVNNTVSASSTYTDSAGNTEILEETDDGFCVVGGLVNVEKLTQSAVDPTKDWTFTLYEGPDGYGGEVLASSSTFDDADGILVFGDYNLDPDKTYTVCENEIPAGWTSFWQVDTDGDGVADTTVIPYNPNQYDDPPQDIGNRCFDIGAGTTVPIPAGGMVFFQVDNTYPGGEPRTPGYWKNWNYCTGGGQADTADQNGGWQYGYWLLEDVLDPTIGGGIVWDDIMTDDLVFDITTCEQAVSILDQRDLVTGNKRASDGAYTLAMHLLAAQMNFAAGAETCQEALDASLDAEELLDEHDFIGEGSYLSSKDDDYAYALELAETLDQYNNGELCTP